MSNSPKDVHLDTDLVSRNQKIICIAVAKSLVVENLQPSDTPPAELSKVVDELIDSLSSKFSSISRELITKSTLAII